MIWAFLICCTCFIVGFFVGYKNGHIHCVKTFIIMLAPMVYEKPFIQLTSKEKEDLVIFLRIMIENEQKKHSKILEKV